MAQAGRWIVEEYVCIVPTVSTHLLKCFNTFIDEAEKSRTNRVQYTKLVSAVLVAQLLHTHRSFRYHGGPS